MSGRRRLAGAALLAAVVTFALLGPLLTSHDPARQDLMRVLEPPSLFHPLGTDHLGRSMLARLAAATRLSLGTALLAVGSAAILGNVLGVLAAWRGGWVDRLCGAVAEAVLALPGLLLVLLLAALAPGSYLPLYLGLSIVLWVEYFRVVRATSSVILAGPQVEASRLLGFGMVYVARRHLLPALAPTVGTLLAFGAGSAVLSLAALGFVGVGIRPPTAEWGIMMTELFPYYQEAPWLFAQPVALLVVTVAGLALLADREAA